MNILATVKVGGREITQSWRFLENEPRQSEDGLPMDFLVILTTEDKRRLAIPLETHLIRQFEKDKFIREFDGDRCYLGTLDINNAVFV